jgi:hypothetical protein
MFGREFISIILRNLSSIQPALRERQSQFRAKPPYPKISVKNYMSAKVGWAIGFLDWVDAFIRHSFIE